MSALKPRVLACEFNMVLSNLCGKKIKIDRFGFATYPRVENSYDDQVFIFSVHFNNRVYSIEIELKHLFKSVQEISDRFIQPLAHRVLNDIGD